MQTIPKMNYPLVHLCFLSITFTFLNILTNFTTPSSATDVSAIGGTLKGVEIASYKALKNFTGKAEIRIDIQYIIVATPPESPFNASLAGFFYASSPAFVSLERTQIDASCLIGAPGITPVLPFKELSSLDKSTYHKTVHVESTGVYTLLYQNCQPETSISMDSRYEITAPGVKSFHGSLDFHAIIIMYMVSFVFFIYLAIWSYICLKNRHYITKYYVLVGDLLLVKCLDSIPNLNYYVSVCLTFLVYIFVFFIILECCLVLRDFVTKKVFWVLIIMLILQCGGVPHREDIFWMPYSYKAITLSAYGISFIVTVAIIFVVVIVLLMKSVDRLKNTLALGGTPSRGLECLRLFLKTYIGFAVYYMVALVGVSVFSTIVGIKKYWVILAIQEAMGLVFFGFILYIFRPSEWNNYLLCNVQPGSADIV